MRRANSRSASVNTTGLPTGFRGAGEVQAALREPYVSDRAMATVAPSLRHAFQKASIRFRMASEIRFRPSGVCLPDFR